MLKLLEMTVFSDDGVRKSSVLEKSLYDKSIPVKSVGQFAGSHKQVDLCYRCTLAELETANYGAAIK